MKSIILMLTAIFFLSTCGGDSLTPEGEVRNTLKLIEEAAEARSISDFTDHISDSYSDHQGNDKAAIKAILQLLFLRNQSINIFTLIHSIDIQGDIAAVEISAAMAARGIDLTQESNRLKADTHHFSLVLQQVRDTNWQVQSVSWKRGWGNG